MVETKSGAKRSVNVGLIVRTFIRWPEDTFQLSTDAVLCADMLALQLVALPRVLRHYFNTCMLKTLTDVITLLHGVNTSL